MGDVTAIEWTDHTFNPWWGCTRVSTACRECYAERMAVRTGHDVWGSKAPRRKLSEKNWRRPLAWNAEAEREGRPHRVFCASMADVFEDHPEVVDERARLWGLVARTPWLHWQLLTKRPENVRAMTPWGTDWPPNVWLGCTAENQATADQRLPVLLGIEGPAVFFVSYEPAVGAVDFAPWLAGAWCDHPSATGTGADHWSCDVCGGLHTWVPSPFNSGVQNMVNVTPGRRVGWLICGGETGPMARPMHPGWASSALDQATEHSVPFFFKQWGDWWPGPTLTPSSQLVTHHGHFCADGHFINRSQAKDTAVFMAKVGHALAGKELEGHVWQQFPEGP